MKNGFLKKGLLRDAVFVATACIVAFAVYLLLFGTVYSGALNLPWLEPTYGAFIAKNLSQGKGFTSNVMDVSSLSFGSEGSPLKPNLKEPPLYPLLLSLFFLFLGANETSLCLCLLLVYVVSVLAFFSMCSSFLERKNAFFATAFYGLSATVLNLGLYSPNALVSVSFLLITITILLKGKAEHPPLPIVLGIFSGLAFLSAYRAILFLLIAFGLAFRWKLFQSKKALVTVAGAFGVTLFPWFVRNMVLSGNPFFTSSLTQGWMLLFSGESHFYINPELAGGGKLTLARLAQNVGRALLSITSNFNLLVLVGAIGALFWKCGDTKLKRLKVVGILFFVLAVLFMAFRWSPESLLWIAPCATVFAAEYILVWLRSFPGLRGVRLKAVTIAIVLLYPLPIFNGKCYKGSGSIYPFLERCYPSLPEGTIVFSDSPHEIGYRSGIPTCYLPADPENIKSLLSNQPYKHLAFLLTPGFIDFTEASSHTATFDKIFEKLFSEKVVPASFGFSEGWIYPDNTVLILGEPSRISLNDTEAE